MRRKIMGGAKGGWEEQRKKKKRDEGTGISGCLGKNTTTQLKTTWKVRRYDVGLGNGVERNTTCTGTKVGKNNGGS